MDNNATGKRRTHQYSLKIAFGISDASIARSTGLTEEDVRRSISGEQDDEAVELTMDNFCSTIDTEINKIRKKLNLNYEIPVNKRRRPECTL